MKKYLIIVEKTETGYSTYSPDVPGCGSTGETKEEVERNIQEAIQFHLEGLRAGGYESLNHPLLFLHRRRCVNHRRHAIDAMWRCSFSLLPPLVRNTKTRQS